MMQECHYCKGNLEEKQVSRVQHYNEQWFLIENVPALVCVQCGEMFYTPQSHDLVLKLLQEMTQPDRVEPLNVLDASKAS